MSQYTERNARQRELLDPRQLRNVRVTVVGVGAIGRQIALQLAAIGMPRVTIVDFDIVEEVNLSAQGFREADLGMAKVDAVQDAMEAMNSEIKINAVNERYNELHGASPKGKHVIFSCVDDVDARRLIFETAEFDLFVDTRMAAELIRTLAVRGDGGDEAMAAYAATLFSANEAEAGRCTQQTTIYCANIGAGLAVSQMTKWLRGMDVDPDVMFTIPNYGVIHITPDMLDRELSEEDEESADTDSTSVETAATEESPAVDEERAVGQLEEAEE